MARIEESIEIRCPAMKAFAFTTDAKTWSRWQTIIPEAEQTSPGSVGIGTTFRGTNRMLGRTMQWTAIVTEYEPAKKFGKNIVSGPVRIEQHDTYIPTEEGTRFILSYDVTVNGFMKLISPLIVRTMQKELRKSLAGLKQILEKE
jgi:hypothetical protein